MNSEMEKSTWSRSEEGIVFRSDSAQTVAALCIHACLIAID